MELSQKPSTPPSSGTQALDRAAQLVSIIVHAPESASYRDLVEQTDLPRSTASRLLNALIRHDLVSSDDSGNYVAGALFQHYAAHFDQVEALSAAAEPILERISVATGETVNLAVLRSNAVMYVSQVDTPSVIGAMNWNDVEVPSHCSAPGKVFYAFDALALPTEPLERRTQHTIVEPVALSREFERIRTTGYAITLGEYEEGLVGVAAPVFGSGPEPTACIGVSGPEFRIGDELDEIGARLIDECARLSKAM